MRRVLAHRQALLRTLTCPAIMFVHGSAKEIIFQERRQILLLKQLELAVILVLENIHSGGERRGSGMSEIFSRQMKTDLCSC